jgi:ubiquinone biosynthesis protein
MNEAIEGTAAGNSLRNEMGIWIDHFFPATALVPEVYAQWRPLVRDSMMFVVSRLSGARLAAKLAEQTNLPPGTSPELRLLRLIAEMPGLQKLGQMLARNRHLHPSLRDTLSQLENGIRDVKFDDIRELILNELGPRLGSYAVEVEATIFSEASVSAAVRFTWRNPYNRRRERGIFKVLKPHIPVFFTEDLDLLRQLAKFLSTKQAEYGFATRIVPETFHEVQQLLQHELDFPCEQAALDEAQRLYRNVSGIRIPQLVRPLCTSKITAITEEQGEKVTEAVSHMSLWQRNRVAEQLIEALIAVPLFVAEGSAMFHADPHAGNLLYDARTSELVILDWALTERLSHEQQRHLALLFLAVSLRDPASICEEIYGLNQDDNPDSANTRVIRNTVIRFLAQLPLARLTGSVDAVRLLEQLALNGVRFPSPLIMLRKVLFTLDDILYEIAGPTVSMDFILARCLVRRWMANTETFGSPLSFTDWMAVQCSALFYGARWWIQLTQSNLERAIGRPSGAIGPRV